MKSPATSWAQPERLQRGGEASEAVITQQIDFHFDQLIHWKMF